MFLPRNATVLLLLTEENATTSVASSLAHVFEDTKQVLVQIVA